MPFFNRKTTPKPALNDAEKGLLQMIDRMQAVIHFSPDGTVLYANANFLGAMGYTAEEIIGQHHSMFIDDRYAHSDDYATFWDRLRKGESFSNRFSRKRKSGDDIWIQATYAPVCGPTVAPNG